MLKRLALAVVLVGLAPFAAQAHGPSRQTLTKTIEINASPDKVWAVMGNFQDMSWLPMVAKTEGTGGNEANAKRTLTLKNGGVIQESLDDYDAKEHRYHYEIDKVDVKVLPVNDYSSKLSVEADGDGKSKVTWWGGFYRGYMNNDPPPNLNDATALKAVTGIYEAGLANLKKIVEGGK